jgi:hypothetical protein
MVQEAGLAPLYVSFGHRGSALGTHGELVKRLEAGKGFELVQTFWGQDEEQFTQYLYRLKTLPAKVEGGGAESR